MSLLTRGSALLRRPVAPLRRGSTQLRHRSAQLRHQSVQRGRPSLPHPWSVLLRRRDASGEPRNTPALPLYPRLLRLRHVRPGAWQRAALAEGVVGVAVLLVLADVASAWTLLALPLAVAGMVKAHDVLAGLLRRPGGP